MKTANKKTLNKAEKGLILTLFIAVLFASIKPQVASAAEVSINMFEAVDLPQIPIEEEMAPITIKKTVSVVATAYSSTPDQTDSSPFVTSNGKWVYDGLIAANGLKYGTKIRFPDVFGDKIFTVNDRMNSRYGASRIDIWMQTREQAKLFGVKRLRMQIIE